MRRNYLLGGAALIFAGAGFWTLFLVLGHQYRSNDWVCVVLLLITGVLAWRKGHSIPKS